MSTSAPRGSSRRREFRASGGVFTLSRPSFKVVAIQQMYDEHIADVIRVLGPGGLQALPGINSETRLFLFERGAAKATWTSFWLDSRGQRGRPHSWAHQAQRRTVATQWSVATTETDPGKEAQWWISSSSWC